MRSNGLPSGHTDINRCHPGLEEDLLEGVLVSKVPSASFELEVVKDKATEDVERLSEVGETASVVREELRRVVLMLHDSFSEKHERLGGGEALGRFPFLPNSLVGVPLAMGHGTLEQAVLGTFLGT